MKRSSNSLFLLLATVLLVSACSKFGNKRPTSSNPGKESTATGIDYNTKEGYKVAKFKGQPTGPNLVFIEGGRFTMGALEEDVLNARDNFERTVTVQSFYMDETEIANVHYLEYIYAIQRDSTEEVYQAALPDSTVWSDPLAFNDSYIDQYLRYPGFRYFPVVGVSWKQAFDYSSWRTIAVNNDLALKAAKGSGKGKKRGKKGDAAAAEVAAAAASGSRPAIETGYVLPNYRLPTEAEWEYAAKAMIGTQDIDENQTNQRIYPWDGSS
ncbi:MAG: SUMF1/EgtB/PvdO family nonheme iron enzyme, partial [Cytophagaceae bacterium]|nr:SUMF1/EgtB/PvdO family nonheme iron enzyme [Cytophagaceae bacterium]